MLLENKTIIESWINSSDKDFLTMNDMYKTNHNEWISKIKECRLWIKQML